MVDVVSSHIPNPLAPQRDLNELCYCIRRLEWILSGKAQERGLQYTVIETIRTPERQKELLRQGVSWTTKSKHLPQPPNGKALAFDIYIDEYVNMKFWNPAGKKWRQLGELAEKTGLEWGGRWKTTPDSGHFQLSKCLCKEGEKDA